MVWNLQSLFLFIHNLFISTYTTFYTNGFTLNLYISIIIPIYIVPSLFIYNNFHYPFHLEQFLCTYNTSFASAIYVISLHDFSLHFKHLLKYFSYTLLLPLFPLLYNFLYLKWVSDAEDALYLIMADGHLPAVHIGKQRLALIPANIFQEDDGVLMGRVACKQTLWGKRDIG